MSTTHGFAGLDTELAEPLPDGDWEHHKRLPAIACADVALDDGTHLWFCPGKEPCAGMTASDYALPRHEAERVVLTLAELQRDGYRLVTWNGLKFDLRLLAEASGMLPECVAIARHHYDMMFQVVCERGHMLGLDAALVGMGLKGRSPSLSGRDVPSAWREGEWERVRERCAMDADATRELAGVCEESGCLCWTSKRGYEQTVELSHGWLTVAECLELPLPDTSWMDDPLRRESFLDWFGGAGALN